jgi:hypothetical protein
MSNTENSGQSTSPSEDLREQGNDHVKGENGEREPATGGDPKAATVDEQDDAEDDAG